jgi:nicotinate-nucleotide adenylyltransferase
MHIALFGTSADPPTLGHQTILHWLSRRFDIVAVWASDNPFKSDQTPIHHRVQMLKLLIEDTPALHHNIQFCPELSSSRTLDSVQAAQQIWKKAQFTIVIGSDLVSQLPRWYQVQQWITHVNLLIMPRPGAPIHEADLAELRRMGATVAIAPIMGLDTSSSSYRQQGNRHAISPAIQAYIHQAQLYPCQDVLKEKQPMR